MGTDIPELRETCGHGFLVRLVSNDVDGLDSGRAVVGISLVGWRPRQACTMSGNLSFGGADVVVTW